MSWNDWEHIEGSDSECLEIQCDLVASLNPLTNTNVPRIYKRLVSGKWQIYVWQLNRLRSWVANQGGVISSEVSAFFIDSAFAIALDGSRFNTGQNPYINNSGALTQNQHHINYANASYLDLNTENPVYFRHAIIFEVSRFGCDGTIEVKLDLEINNNNAATGWTFIEPNNQYIITEL